MSHKELQILDNKYKRLKILNVIVTPILWILIIGGLIAFLVYIYFENLMLSIVMLGISAVSLIIFFVVKRLYKNANKNAYSALENSILYELGCSEWEFTEKKDAYISVKSSQAISKLNDVKFFKEDGSRLSKALSTMEQKKKYAGVIKAFLKQNNYTGYSHYKLLETSMNNILNNLEDYFVVINYTSPAGKKSVTATMTINAARLKELETDKSILMTKGEYNRYIKEKGTELLGKKQHSFFERVNAIIDTANNNKDSLIIKGEADILDKHISALFDRTVNSIKKIKSVDSEEWDVLDNFISGIEDHVNRIVDKNQQILDYYQCDDFKKIKTTCNTLMSSQREFNEYIDEKVKSISSLFGTNIVRNETVNDDEYNYFHPYKKSITPFTAEVSASVFASAENNPLDYVVKIFYPNKNLYPEQILKLHTLIEELETLKEAKQIIEKYKSDIQEYLTEVPSFIMENDEDGFYSRLGFATINENTLVVAYKFSYTSNGGRAQRSFTVPMTEETIIDLINILESKLTMIAFTKEQRSLMTDKLRQHIKERDDYTCQFCGNSTYKEPNLLLEIDHIIPVVKGGLTEETNLQTLCWRCNRSKSSKIL